MLDPVLPEDVRKLGQIDQCEIFAALDLSHTFFRALDGTITRWCQGNHTLFGWSPEEAIGCLSHLLLRTKFPKPRSEVQKELLDRGFWQGELWHSTKSGVPIWVAAQWVLQRNLDGSPRLVIETNTDITDRKRADDVHLYLASVVESSDDAIVSEDLNGIVTSWNPAAERLFGYTAAEIVGTTIVTLFPPEQAEDELEILERIHRGERIQHYETVRLSKSGRRINVSLSVSPIRNAAGDVIGASKIARDISHGKALKEAFRESEERRRLAVEAGEVGLWSMDAVSRQMNWSSRCKAIFGLGPEALTPTYKGAFALIHPEDAEQVAHSLETSITEGKELALDFRIIDEAGSIRWVHSKARPFLGPDGRISQICGTLVDLTNRKQTEDALRRSNSQLQQFAYAAAHDLQEPLRNVALSVGLAIHQASETLGQESLVLLNSAIQNAQQMEEMIRDLLSFSTTIGEDAERWPLISSIDALASAMRNLSVEISEAGAIITWDELPLLRIDKTHLQQIFQHVLGNAVKYGGAEPPLIHFSASTQLAFWRLSVADNGIGIDPRFQKRVFGAFKRLRLKDVPGTGLGLALCKRIVEHYGGKIWIHSDGKKGTIFYFTIPGAEGKEHVGS